VSPFLLPALLAFAAGVALHLAALRVFPRLKLLDSPQRYGLSRAPIPYPTGILGVFVFLAATALTQQPSLQLTGVAVGSGLLAFVCFIDDRMRLSPAVRLLVQFFVAVLIFLLGTRIYTVTNPLLPGGIIDLDNWVIVSALFRNPPVWSGIFTVLWLLLTINALNWFDGIPGQVSLLSLLGFLTIGLLAVSPRVTHLDPAAQQSLAVLAFTLAGIAASGLLFDFPPAKVLMGDTGSMFFGLMLGVLTVYAGGKVATAFLVLGVPLIDSGIVILKRIAKGKSPLKGSAGGEHLHHLLLARGWTQRQVVLCTAMIGMAFGGTALFLGTQQKFIAGALLLLVMIGLHVYARPGRDR
jgi:UDP-GlcNAc:undecaprenyl-phosphate GlcNAc-1-phosphate transferase